MTTQLRDEIMERLKTAVIGMKSPSSFQKIDNIFCGPDVDGLSNTEKEEAFFFFNGLIEASFPLRGWNGFTHKAYTETNSE